MKKIALLALLATGLAASAPAAITAGVDAGYLTEAKDAYWSGRVGWLFRTTSNFSHQVELEFGYTKESKSIGATTGEAERTPIMINYRVETTAADKLGYYFGAGLGRSRTSIDINLGSGTVYSYGENGRALQAFAGMRYNLTPAVTLHAGARYLRMNRAQLPGVSVEQEGDVALTAGVSVRF